MRLDQFLKASRLCLRRTVAQELCEAEAVRVNGLTARASRSVHVGDEITVNRRGRLLTVRVLAVPETRQPSRRDAPSLYQVINETVSPDIA